MLSKQAFKSSGTGIFWLLLFFQKRIYGSSRRSYGAWFWPIQDRPFLWLKVYLKVWSRHRKTKKLANEKHGWCFSWAYIRNTHLQEEILLFGGKNQNWPHKVQGFGWLVWKKNEFYISAGKNPHPTGSDARKFLKIIYNYLYIFYERHCQITLHFLHR